MGDHSTFDRGHDREFADPFPGGHDRDDSSLRAELSPGETILWQGQPRVGSLVVRNLPVALLGIPFGGFAVFWTYTATSMAGPMGLFGIPFLVAGAGMLLSPIWVALGAMRTWYAVTDRRAILCDANPFSVTVRSYAPAALGNMARTQRWDGSGDLIFEEILTRNHNGHRHTTRRGFKAIPDVRRVEALIQSSLLAEWL